MQKFPSHFCESAKALATQAVLSEKDVGVVHIDIKELSKFNDKFGHLIGDVCISLIEKHTLSVLSTGLCIRLSFGKFLYFSQSTSKYQTRSQCDSILTLMQENKFSDGLTQYNFPELHILYCVAKADAIAALSNQDFNNLLSIIDETSYKAKLLQNEARLFEFQFPHSLHAY